MDPGILNELKIVIFCDRRLGVTPRLFLKDHRAENKASVINSASSQTATHDLVPNAARATSEVGKDDRSDNMLCLRPCCHR